MQLTYRLRMNSSNSGHTRYLNYGNIECVLTHTNAVKKSTFENRFVAANVNFTSIIFCLQTQLAPVSADSCI